jgi:hypothetical protein
MSRPVVGSGPVGTLGLRLKMQEIRDFSRASDDFRGFLRRISCFFGTGMERADAAPLEPLLKMQEIRDFSPARDVFGVLWRRISCFFSTGAGLQRNTDGLS